MKIALIGASLIFISGLVMAGDPITINNNMAPPAANENNPPANNSPQTDPRVPPAGVYSTNGPDGTSTTYTTGEKKPYYVDNGTSNTPTPQVYPQVYPQGVGPTNQTTNAAGPRMNRQ